MDARFRCKGPVRRRLPQKVPCLCQRPRCCWPVGLHVQQLDRAEPAVSGERRRVVMRAAPGRERRRVLPALGGPSCHLCVVGCPGAADGGAARGACPHGRCRPLAGGCWRHVGVSRHSPCRLGASLGATGGASVPHSPPCACRSQAKAFPFLGSLHACACAAAAPDLPQHAMDGEVKEKRTLPNGEKNTFVQQCRPST